MKFFTTYNQKGTKKINLFLSFSVWNLKTVFKCNMCYFVLSSLAWQPKILLQAFWIFDWPAPFICYDRRAKYGSLQPNQIFSARLSLLECAQEKWRGVGANWPHGLNEGSSHSAHRAQNSDLIPQAKRSGGSVSSQGLLLLCALWKFHAFKTQNLIDPPSFTFPIHPLGERRRRHDNPSFLFLNIFW